MHGYSVMNASRKVLRFLLWRNVRGYYDGTGGTCATETYGAFGNLMGSNAGTDGCEYGNDALATGMARWRARRSQEMLSLVP